MIKEFEYYHGAALTQLIHGATEGIVIKPYPSGSNASYVINEKIGIYIKHSAKRMTPWRFTLNRYHQDEILEMKQKHEIVFVILVCSDDGIVTLSYDYLKCILDEVHDEVEWISASRNKNKEYTIKGSDGTLGRKIGKNDYPKKILDAMNSFSK